MTSSSSSKYLSKDAFLRLFNISGMLSERLFKVFDVDQDGVINFGEFLDGLAVFYKGSSVC